MASYRLIWAAVAGGELAIGHKPGRKLREQLEVQGCTLVVNLLSDAESKASESDRRVRLRLATANPPDDERTPEILALFARMRTELGDGGKVYLHCSAGLHRTGMIANAFLRHLGHTQAAALELIRELRPLTADQVGQARLHWGEKFAP